MLLFHNLLFVSVLAGKRSCLALRYVPETKNRGALMAVNVVEWGKTVISYELIRSRRIRLREPELKLEYPNDAELRNLSELIGCRSEAR